MSGKTPQQLSVFVPPLATADVTVIGRSASGLVEQATLGDLAAALLPLAANGGAAWTAWVPGWAQGVGLGTSINAGGYIKMGRLVIATARATFNSAGTPGSALTCSIPVVAAATGGISAFGSFLYTDSGITYYSGACLINNGGSTVFFHAGGNNGGFFASTPAVTVNAPDETSFFVAYQSAA